MIVLLLLLVPPPPPEPPDPVGYAITPTGLHRHETRVVSGWMRYLVFDLEGGPPLPPGFKDGDIVLSPLRPQGYGGGPEWSFPQHRPGATVVFVVQRGWLPHPVPVTLVSWESVFAPRPERP